MVYYAVFASGQRQPWADGKGISLTSDPVTGHLQYDELDPTGRSETDKLLKSLPAAFYDADDDEFGSSMRFLNSI